ncbi:FHA domain-containing protein [Nesterenkonia sp. MY13]|uniref:FHA domain-containing protein n=1 Tax=Nesterenkonia sedimenti TaxID=1463632 RepID=A0A7X8YE08_9MICC|nr:FHA domain-containing protein [Nesterenkonia sedimenti]NLS09985.1 FHA domain-containing protein [Nesterenkonia sedimenti]
MVYTNNHVLALSGLPDGAVLANRRIVFAAHFLDFLLICAGAAAAFTTFPDSLPHWVSALLGAALLLIIQLVLLRTTGQTLFGLIFRFRWADPDTSLPPTGSSWFTALTGTVKTRAAKTALAADLRRGVDPLDLAGIPAEASLPSRGGHWGRVAAETAVFALVEPYGERHPISADSVVGRQPHSSNDEIQPLTLPDVTRTIDKTHGIFRIRNGHLEYTDLGSTHGTTIDVQTHYQKLKPGIPTGLDPGTIIYLGRGKYTIGTGRQEEDQ